MRYSPFRDDLATAGRALAAAGLVTAFGHVSTRTDDGQLLITGPYPLDEAEAWTRSCLLRADLDGLPEGAPGEAHIHVEIARRRPDIRAICRAQPPAVMELSATGRPVRALHGQGAMLGSTVAVFDDAALVRDQARAVALADALADGPAIVLRGNGAVTVGSSLGEAVARMWVLDASARVNLTAARRGSERALTDAEVVVWRAAAPQLLERIWRWLDRPERRTDGDRTT